MPTHPGQSSPIEPLKQARANFEREHIQRALQAHDWNVSRTAESLGIERSHLHRKIKELNIRSKSDDEGRLF